MSVHNAFDYMAGFAAALLVGVGIAAAPAPARQTPEPRVIEVVAKKFAFVPSRIEVTEGETVRLVVRSADGMHGLQIKKFKVAEEIPRGSEAVTIEFTANAVGEFEIACTAFCGKGHEEMRGKLVVLPRETRAR
jgi:cytochrome c oxidase subunit 2